MRFLPTILPLFFAIYVAGQTATSASLGAIPSNVPLCALSCASLFTTSTSTCSSSDTACLCNSSAFQVSAASCIVDNCSSSSDQEEAYNYAKTLCSNAGVTLPSLSQLTAEASTASSTSTGAVITGTSSSSNTATAQSSSGGHIVISMGAFIFCIGLGFLWI